MSTQYTVVLLRSQGYQDITETDYGQDIYVAHVEADSLDLAIQDAKEEAARADTVDFGFPVSPEGFKLCVMFEGHLTPTLFGWQS